MTTIYRVRITAKIAEEYEIREMAECYDGDANPYTKIAELGFGGGSVQLTEPELRELMDDATFYADPYGPANGDLGMQSAYRALGRQCAKALVK